MNATQATTATPDATATQSVTRFTVNTKALTDAFTRLTRIIDSTRSSEFKVIHFKLLPGELHVAAQSDINQLSIRIPTDSTTTHDFRVPSALLAQVANSIDNPDVTLELTATELHLSAGTYSSHFTLVNSTDIPPVEFPDETISSDLTGETLQAMLQHTIYAVGDEKKGNVYTSVFLHFTGEHSRAVATNGFRLSYWSAPGGDLFKNNEILIPATEAQHVLRNFTEGPIRMHAANGTITFETNDTIFRTRTEQGQFPAYERIIPKQFVCEIEIDAPVLVKIAKRLLPLGDPALNNRLDLLMTPDDNTLVVSIEGQHGSAKETVEARITNGGAPPMISINAKYLLEALTPIEGAARIQLSGQTTPLVISNTSHDNYTSVIVPLKDKN